METTLNDKERDQQELRNKLKEYNKKETKIMNNLFVNNPVKNLDVKSNEKVYVLVSKELSQFIKQARETELDFIYSVSNKVVDFKINGDTVGKYPEGTIIKITTEKQNDVNIEIITVENIKYNFKHILEYNTELLTTDGYDDNCGHYTTDSPYKCIVYTTELGQITIKDLTTNINSPTVNTLLNKIDEINKINKIDEIALKEWYNTSIDLRRSLLDLFIQIHGISNLAIDINQSGIPIFSSQFYGFIFKMLVTNKDIEEITK